MTGEGFILRRHYTTIVPLLCRPCVRGYTLALYVAAFFLGEGAVIAIFGLFSLIPLHARFFFFSVVVNLL